MPTMSMSASGGKADIPDTSHQCQLLTQADISSLGGPTPARFLVIAKKNSGLIQTDEER